MTETVSTEAATAETEAAEAKATEAKVLEAIENWDEEKAGAEDAAVGPKLLNQVVPVFKELVAVADKYRAATDVDEAVKAYTFPEGSEEATLALQIEQAKALIAKNTAILDEAARKAVIANVDPNFDEQKVKAAFKDTRNDFRARFNSIRDTFEMLGYVEYDLSPAGRKTNYRGTNEYGSVLVALSDIPSIERGGSSNSPVDEAAKKERKDAKEWGKENGWEVADKGQISKDLLEAYRNREAA